MEKAGQEVSNISIPRHKSMKAEVLDVPSKFEECGFSNYIPRNSWEAATKKVLIDFAKNPEEKRSLVLVGNIGTGKTHLAVAVLKNLSPIIRKMAVATDYITGEKRYGFCLQRSSSQFLVMGEFFRQINDTYTDKVSKDRFMKKILSQNDMVCLDELDTDNFSPAKTENLYLFVNRAYLDQKRIIITSNHTMEELERHLPKITSRLAEIALVIRFNGSDYRKEKH
jgi:DNA replication protein DnaC